MQKLEPEKRQGEKNEGARPSNACLRAKRATEARDAYNNFVPTYKHVLHRNHSKAFKLEFRIRVEPVNADFRGFRPDFGYVFGFLDFGATATTATAAATAARDEVSRGVQAQSPPAPREKISPFGGPSLRHYGLFSGCLVFEAAKQSHGETKSGK